VSEIPGPASQRRPASTPGTGQQLSRLQAEQAFQRGLRYLRAEQFRRAADALTDAAGALPDALEYQLYAKWASYRACEVPDELGYLRSELEPLAKLLAKQDRAHALPPYVLGHLALAAEDEGKALKLFKMAARRDPRNKDAERHVRVLSTRVSKA
jgi:tetratricopeptide (TPR) repeat protein